MFACEKINLVLNNRQRYFIIIDNSGGNSCRMKCCNQINHVVGAFGEKLSGDSYNVLSAFYMQ